VASELLTNGLLHAAAEPVTLRAGFTERQFLVEVMSIDRPPAGPAAPRPRSDPLRETGRGLQIVAALCDEQATTITGRVRVASCWMSRGRLAGGAYR
jgi:anti-sigma regulatory factor (Ser/Thr protein kinase)